MFSKTAATDAQLEKSSTHLSRRNLLERCTCQHVCVHEVASGGKFGEKPPNQQVCGPETNRVQNIGFIID